LLGYLAHRGSGHDIITADGRYIGGCIGALPNMGTKCQFAYAPPESSRLPCRTASLQVSMPPPKTLSVGKALNDTVDLDAVRGKSMNLCGQFVCSYKWSIPTREQLRHSYKVLLFGRAVTNTEHALRQSEAALMDAGNINTPA
jgi:hypothetical protein